jgi:hypothetical protein
MKRRPALLESLSEILARRQINRHSENDTDKSADSHQEMDGFTRQFIVRMREFLGLRMSPEQAVARKND